MHREERILSRQVSNPSLYRDKNRSPFVLHKEHQALCRLGAAGIPANQMHIVWPFIKGLPWPERQLLPALHLHDDPALQHVDKHVGIVPVDNIRCASVILHRNHGSFFPRNSCQLL